MTVDLGSSPQMVFVNFGLLTNVIDGVADSNDQIEVSFLIKLARIFVVLLVGAYVAKVLA